MIQNLFSIPIYISKVFDKENIQKELLDVFAKSEFEKNIVYRDSHKITDNSFRQSILHQNNCKFFLKELNNHVLEYLKEIDSKIDLNMSNYRITSWMTLNEKGDYTAQHHHGAADMSGVYYIQTPEDSGDLFFKNPNKVVSSSICYYQMPDVAVGKVETGDIILFPGWLDHGVLTSRSEKQRISLSFNLTFNRDSM